MEKIRFLKQFIADLKLDNVIAVQTRVENEDRLMNLVSLMSLLVVHLLH
jgi:16S rRNA (guanine527-N7)-methyltransferase